MRTGHRNTNQILTLSFNLLLGAFAAEDPQTAEFAGIGKFEKGVIPQDPAVDHPHAGKPYVERLGDRQYRVNFAVDDGPSPNVRACRTEAEMLSRLAAEVKQSVDPGGANVDPCDVLVMVPERRHIEAVVREFASRKIDTHVPVRMDGERTSGPGRHRQPDPRDLGCFLRGKVTVS